MKKVLIVITSDIYVRNYLRTDAFTELQRRFQCEFIADSRLKNRRDLEDLEGFRGYFSIPDRIRKLHEFHFNLMMWRNRKLSRTFTYRWLRNSAWHKVAKTGKFWTRTVTFSRWLLSALINPVGLRVPILGNPVVFPVTAGILRKQLGINSEIRRLTNLEPYDLFLFPSSAFEAATVDLIRIGKEQNIPTLCLIDNWDNLTSKTVFWHVPTHLGVWGEQAKSQAIDIHGFAPEKVFPLGTPRFHQYFEARKAEIPRHYQYKYTLFVGSAMPFDELGSLRKLEQIHLELPSNLRPDHIIYRPHPWQQKRMVDAVFNEKDFSIVVLDSQIADAYKTGVSPEKTDERFQPDLAYYPSLLRHADLVVGPLTTMLLEAALLLRPVIGLSYFDGVHSNTSLRYFSHFEGTQKIPGFYLCETQDLLAEVVTGALQRGAIEEFESDSATQYFVHRDSNSYPQRLAGLVEKIVRG